MPRYRAREPIYLSNEGRLIEAGEEFASDATPGLAWTPLESPAEPASAPRKAATPAK
jgi:hypothetical protein